MLGRDVMAAAAAADVQATGWDLPELNVTDPENLESRLAAADWIINCSAFTRVDDAETEREAAFAVNADGVRNLGLVASRHGIRLLHISTDYVFDGTSDRPYIETDRTNPLNVYGASKLAGEEALRSIGGPYIIARTQSLFGHHGPNFVKAIVRKLKEGDAPLRVVNDQRSAPTYTRHLAIALLRLLKVENDHVLHVVASGGCSWYEFACAIVERVKPGHEVIPVSSDEYVRPAKRPMNSLLNTQHYEKLTGYALPTWVEGLDAYLEEEQYFK